MVGRFRKLTRALGFDIAPFPGAAGHWSQLAGLLARHRVSLVFDVGANVGQYAGALRSNGYGGRIVSFEPVSSAHAALTAAASRDEAWQVAPRCAVGAAPGETDVNISPESDMSSLLPLTADTAGKFASVRPTGSEPVPVTTLATEIARYASDSDVIFVKSDTQGYESEVLSGLGAAAARVSGLQLELSLLPIYQGQPGFLSIQERVDELGFAPQLVIPGYFSRQHGQMIEFDMVFFRSADDFGAK